MHLNHFISNVEDEIENIDQNNYWYMRVIWTCYTDWQNSVVSNDNTASSLSYISISTFRYVNKYSRPWKNVKKISFTCSLFVHHMSFVFFLQTSRFCSGNCTLIRWCEQCPYTQAHRYGQRTADCSRGQSTSIYTI